MSSSEVASITKQAIAAQEAKPKKKICCACPDTKRLRDECIAEHGPEDCGQLIEAHLRCLRAEGFNSEEKHRDHLIAFFNELRKNRLLINAKKSEFFLEEIHFLGHIVSKSGVCMDLAKIEAFKSWPDLKTVHDIRSFVGLCSYYRRFIRHFAKIASPLHALTHKGVTFKWTTKEITAFKHLKEKLTSDPVIILPDLLKPFVVQCDACGNSLGAVLMQDGQVGAHESRVFSNRERTLQIYEKEMLVVMHALYNWKYFLLCADFVVQTDHQTLRYFLTQAKLSEQLMRWANFLSMFHF
ncbi:hypothetical protein L7F22_011568 [Adiantum nelumboides]|nr:hypothetical protein [Adiantum nelumboides]